MNWLVTTKNVVFPIDRYRCISFRYGLLHIITLNFDFLWQLPTDIIRVSIWLMISYNSLHIMLSCILSEFMLILLVNSWGIIATSEPYKTHIVNKNKTAQTAYLLIGPSWTQGHYLNQGRYIVIVTLEDLVKFEPKYETFHTEKRIWKFSQIAAHLPRHQYVYTRLSVPRIY